MLIDLLKKLVYFSTYHKAKVDQMTSEVVTQFF